MKFTTNIINEIIAEIVGEDVLPIVEFLKDKRNISEFKIAESTRMEVNAIRNILYRLHTHNLISYHRKKDKVKGWYISYWTMNLKTIKHLHKKTQHEKLDKLKDRLIKEENNLNQFFICVSMCTRLDLEQATDLEFKCPECGQLLNLQENAKTIENLRTKIKELEGAIGGIA